MGEMRAVAWGEVGPHEYIRPGHPLWDQTVAEMEAEGFRPVWERAHHWSTFAVAVFRRRPPTAEERLEEAREAADELDEALGEWFAFSPWVPRDREDAVMGPGDIWLRVEAARQALRDAVEGEEARCQ